MITYVRFFLCVNSMFSKEFFQFSFKSRISLPRAPHELVRQLRFRDLVYIDGAGKCGFVNFSTTKYVNFDDELM